MPSCDDNHNSISQSFSRVLSFENIIGKSDVDSQKEKIIATDETKRNEISFDELPDDIHLNIFNLLELPSRLRLRINKRLDRLQFTVKNKWRYLDINIFSDRCKLSVCHSNRRFDLEYRNFDQLNKILLRFAINTFFHTISIRLHSQNKASRYVIDTLLNFNADYLSVPTLGVREIPFSLQVDIRTILNLVENVKDVRLSLRSASSVLRTFSTIDLCTLHKEILNAECKQISFYLLVDEEMAQAFLEECFGVTIVAELHKDGRHKTTFRVENESLELSNGVLNNVLTHFENDIQTTVRTDSIWFRKGNIEDKAEQLYELKKNCIFVNQC